MELIPWKSEYLYSPRALPEVDTGFLLFREKVTVLVASSPGNVVVFKIFNRQWTIKLPELKDIDGPL